MAEILFLTHRIPFPPSKGDKIRSWHILRHLASQHTVHLGCFIDNADDLQYESRLRSICAECHFEQIGRSPLNWRNLRAMIGGESVTVSHYRRPGMTEWVERIMQQRPIKALLAFSGTMGQYVMQLPRTDVRRVIDFVDVDSEKWRSYAATRRFPLRWVYDREARLLCGFERSVAYALDASIFVSSNEARLFCDLAPDLGGKVTTIRNGVDSGYFTPEVQSARPFPADKHAIVFVGAMDYWANEDGVVWFSEEVLPLVARERSDVEFWIVGASPTRFVRRLCRQRNVRVTGLVPDVRPYLRHAAVIVVPLRIARGVQNKVLEAMAMARAVVVSSLAARGVEAALSGRDYLVADDAPSFAAAVLGIISDNNWAEELGRNARARVLSSYDWQTCLRGLENLLGC